MLRRNELGFCRDERGPRPADLLLAELTPRDDHQAHAVARERRRLPLVEEDRLPVRDAAFWNLCHVLREFHDARVVHRVLAGVSALGIQDEHLVDAGFHAFLGR